MARSLRFEPFLHFQLQFDDPFCMCTDSLRHAPLYVIGGRDCWLQFGDAPAMLLRHGDAVFLPRGGPHRIFSDAAAPLVRIEDLLALLPKGPGLSWNQQAAGSDGICSGSLYDTTHLATHPLMASVPAVLHVRAADAAAWLPSATALVRWMADRRTGGKGVGMTETVGVLMQHMVLEWLRRPESIACCVKPSAGEANDPRLLAALDAIYARPAHPWTPLSLAKLCHMSRTAFSIQFQAQTGLSPVRYLANWRIHLAARLLRERRISLDQVAVQVGYSTGAILARAYKRLLGASPLPQGPTFTSARSNSSTARATVDWGIQMKGTPPLTGMAAPEI